MGEKAVGNKWFIPISPKVTASLDDNERRMYEKNLHR
jgi:hypothetical protein